MGKAGILVVPVTIIVIALIVWGIIWMIGRTPQEPKEVRKKAALADESYELFKDMLLPRNFDNMSILSEDDKTKIKAWADKYRKVSN